MTGDAELTASTDAKDTPPEAGAEGSEAAATPPASASPPAPSPASDAGAPAAAVPTPAPTTTQPSVDPSPAAPADLPAEHGGHTRGGRGWLWWVLGGAVAAAIAAAVAVTLLGRPAPAPPPVVEAPPPEEPGDIALTVGEVNLEPVDNATLTGGEQGEVDAGAAEAAVEESLGVLQDYLNAMFIEEETRLSARALDGLLTDAAAAVLVQADEEALGVVDLAVERSEGEPVSATATVVGDGDTIDVVVLDYDLVVNIEGDGTGGELTQHAEMGFVPDGNGWRVQAVDAALDVPEELEQGGGADGADTAEPTEGADQ